MNSIDIVIPTMWKESNLTQYLKSYCDIDSVRKIFIVDNDRINRPLSDVFDLDKIEIIDYGRNIYVNPAWNEGYFRSQADVLCLLNDDIYVEDPVWEFVSGLDFAEIDIIGVHLKGSVDNYHIVDHPDQEERLIRLNVDKTQPIGGQSYAYGVCMFLKRSSYKPIPSLYQIWYGDDYLIQRSKNIFTLKTSRIKGEISKTLVAADKTSDIKNRLDLDSKNVFKFNHFMNGKNWDLVNNAARKTDLQDLAMYCMSYNAIPPKKKQFKQTTVMCGAALLDDDTRKLCESRGMILDTEGENISSSNRLLGDLTGLYWVWKNTHDEFVGVNQYRRFWNELDLKEKFDPSKKALYISQPKVFDVNFWQQYQTYHGEVGIHVLYHAAKSRKIPITEKMLDGMAQINFVSPANMFFAQRDVFNLTCSRLFDIITELYEGSKYILPYVQKDMHYKGPDDMRLLSYLSERILNVMYANHRYFFGKTEIIPVNYDQL